MKKWFVKNIKADYQAICEQLGVTEVTARLLVNRGLMDEDERDAYLHPFSSCYAYDDLKNAKEAASIIKAAIDSQKKIRIIGDYDVDGIVSVYVLYKTIYDFGGNVDFRIPDRIKDGYGINVEMVNEAKDAGIELIVTCDNGISAAEPLKAASEYGIEVVLTDHHEVPFDDNKRQILPIARTVVDPKQTGETAPFLGICGAVVAYKVMCCMNELYGKERSCMDRFVPYIAIATVCDVMELKNENRQIVAKGLRMFASCSDVGICALIERCGLNKATLSGYHFGFVIGPCLNASGRLDTALKGLNLLLEEDESKAREMAETLFMLNDERKSMTNDGVKKAIEIVTEESYINLGQLPKVIVCYLEGVHESLAGIIAGKVRERFYRPTIILTDAKEDGVVKGSGRSIDGYSMFEELKHVDKLLLKYGGHPMAAGLSLKKKDVGEFAKILNENCSLTEEQFREKLVIDAILPFGLVNERVIDEMAMLEPYGNGNESPVFVERKCTVLSGRVLGANKNAIKLNVENEFGKRYDLMFFGDSDGFIKDLKNEFGDAEVEDVFRGRNSGICLSVAYYPSKNEYRDTITLQAIGKDWIRAKQ